IPQRQRLRAVPREANVGVRAAETLGFGEGDARPLAVARIANRRRRLLLGIHRPRVRPCRYRRRRGASAKDFQKNSSVTTAHVRPPWIAWNYRRETRS